MAAKSFMKIKSLTIPQQVVALRSFYPQSICKAKRNSLFWNGKVQPTPISSVYDLKITYKLKYSPKCYVCTPLLVPAGEELDHVYDQKEQRICLYYPGEWNSSMNIAQTIVPWSSEWLFYYELWLATGKWLGGGIHSSSPKEEN